MEDAVKFVQELIDGPLGDHIRELVWKEMREDLAGSDYDDDREWATSTAEWIEANWG